MTQEVAARGMGLVYDMSPAEGKKELVQGLFSTLMEGRKSVWIDIACMYIRVLL